ncbi:MAG: hypothetical protein M5R38_08080 [Candidatus Methylomirabilis sp.]|nr:hypothetical protein [Candidatus Methylomirabilis sp.]
MTANVTFLVDRRDNVLKIPNAALRFRPPDLKQQQASKEGTVRATASGGGLKGGGGQTVWVLGSDKQPRPVPVTLGITDGSASELLQGDVKEGDEVIIGVASKEAAGGPAQPFGQRGPRF